MSLRRSFWLAPVVAPLVASLALGACSKQAATNKPRDLSEFTCNDRRVEYMLAGGFAADETGITMACDGENPRIQVWQHDGGARTEKNHELTAQQFDDVWKRVDSTGWRHLGDDCQNPDAAFDDPTYSIDVGDHAKTSSMICQGRTLPFPYDRIVNELDLRAAGFGDQDGAAP